MDEWDTLCCAPGVKECVRVYAVVEELLPSCNGFALFLFNAFFFFNI